MLSNRKERRKRKVPNHLGYIIGYDRGKLCSEFVNNIVIIIECK